MKIILKPGQRLLTTADNHYGHRNIIKHCKRPFVDEQDMNRTMTENHNAVVRPDDIVINLGDFSFRGGNPREYLKRLQGIIYVIKGNHDRLADLQKAGFAGVLEGNLDLHITTPDGRQYEAFLNHFPCICWNARYHGRPHLFGHVHSRPDRPFDIRMPKSYDVGVDNNNFFPIEMIPLLERLKLESLPSGERHG